MAMPKKEPLTIYDLCLQTTMSMEGTDFGTVAGNFDGQGVSAGILQWNLGQGTLQSEILNHCNMMSFGYFPLPMDKLNKLSPEIAIGWVKDVMLIDGVHLKSEWKAAWQRFLTEPSVINVQKRSIDKYFHQAKTICSALGFAQENKRAMCFSFDVAVQNWSMSIDVPHTNLDQAYNILSQYGPDNARLWLLEELTEEKAKLVIAAHLRALKCNPKWRSDVFIRKATIAMGLGIVHGKTYKLNKSFI